MKKFLILVIVTLSVALAGYAQNAAVDKTLDYGDTYLTYTGKSSDTLGVGSLLWTYTVRKKCDAKVYPYIYVNMDKVSGTANKIHFIRQGKVFGEETYTSIDSVRWGGTVDTVFKFDDATARKYEYHRLKIRNTGTTVKAKVNYINFKFPK